MTGPIHIRRSGSATIDIVKPIYTDEVERLRLPMDDPGNRTDTE